MKRIDFFLLENCPLPTVAIDKAAPAPLAKEYKRLQGLMPPIDAAREEVQKGLGAIVNALVKKFDAAKLEELRNFRYSLLRLMQAEVEIRDEFAAWLESYQAALADLHAKAAQARAAAAAGVRDKILNAAGFDDVAKAQAGVADGLIGLHPDVRNADAQISQMNKAHEPVLDPVSFDAANAGGAVWIAPASINFERRGKLVEMIHMELASIIRAEGLAPTVQYAMHRAFHQGESDEGMGALVAAGETDQVSRDTDSADQRRAEDQNRLIEEAENLQTGSR